MVSKALQAWLRLSRRHKTHIVLVALLVLVVAVAAVRYMADSNGIPVVDPEHPWYSYLAVFGLVTLDAVIPVFPGETTLNAAATAAAQGTLDLGPVVAMGALGAIVGDSALFWLARRYSRKVEPVLKQARANNQVRQALAIMESSAPALIIGGRYVPGMRFVVNATMGLSDMPYRRFFPWSALSGVLWSTYTCLLAYKIGTALGDYPLASVVISGLVTTVALTLVMLSIRRRRRATAGAKEETG